MEEQSLFVVQGKEGPPRIVTWEDIEAMTEAEVARSKIARLHLTPVEVFFKDGEPFIV